MKKKKDNKSFSARRSSSSFGGDERLGGAPRNSGPYSRHDSFDPTAYGRGTGRAADSRANLARSSSVQVSDQPENPYGRRVSQAEYTQRRKRVKRRRIVAVSLLVVLVLCLGGAGMAFAYYQTISSNLHRGIDQNLIEALTDGTNPQQAYQGEPFYMLLMGTDGSADREASAEYAGDQFRSDSMMLTRVDAQDKKVTMVSLHRDTMVDMGQYGKTKLNAAHSLGGAALTVETVSELAGVPITHYAEINFDGFKEIVDALGGVEVDVPMEINDEDAGGHVDQGLQTLNGDQALILSRARHAYDDYGDGDRYRAANQRLVLAAIAKKILASDPATMANTINALSQYVTTDLEITEILAIAQGLRGMDTEKDIYSAMEPTTSAYIDNTWYEYLDTKAWKTMMTRVDQGLSPTEEDEIDEASGTVLANAGNGAAGGSSTSSEQSGPKTVVVHNGNGTSGAGSVAAEELKKQGYTVETGNADSFDYTETIIVYNREDQATEAKTIANAIGVGKAQLNSGSYSFTGDFLVVLGADF